jgi:hypothetical protein
MKQPLFMDKPIKNYHLSTKMPDFMDRLSKSPSCGETGAGLGFTRYSVALRQGLERAEANVDLHQAGCFREPVCSQALSGVIWTSCGGSTRWCSP